MYKDEPLVDCTVTVPWEPENLAKMQEKLELRWPNVLLDISPGSSHLSFWKHEWEKHGSCATNVRGLKSPSQYLAKALELDEKYPIGKTLEDTKMPAGKSYEADALVSALRSALGKTPQISCYQKQVKYHFSDF